jgi:hypothetical protein
MHVRFRSPSELDERLACGAKDDTFEYDGPDRHVTLHNDCRRYPLRLQMQVREAVSQASAEAILYRFVTRLRSAFDANFRPYLGAALQARIPGLAAKVVVFFSMGRVEVVFRKGSDHAERRRIIDWLVDPDANDAESGDSLISSSASRSPSATRSDAHAAV